MVSEEPGVSPPRDDERKFVSVKFGRPTVVQHLDPAKLASAVDTAVKRSLERELLEETPSKSPRLEIHSEDEDTHNLP